MTKEIHDINTRALDFVVELIEYIFEYPDDDYMTMECLCRKLHKYGLIDKKDGEWTTDFIDHKTDPSLSDKPTSSKDEPTTQKETQNSNLTFKTLEYCNICDHKGCEECISNALDEHCIPSQFKKQIEDECAKEYEELGLKELKELIKADRKTEPTISKMEQVDKDINVRSKDEPQKRCDECIHFDKTYKKRDKYGMLIIGVECDGMDEPCDKWTDEPQTERSNDEE